MHNITIRRVTNGVVVEIGCHTFVHGNVAFAMQEIGDYLISPAATLKRWEPTLKTWYKLQEEGEGHLDVPPAETACDPARPRPDRIRARREVFEEAVNRDAPFYRGDSRGHMETPSERESAVGLSSAAEPGGGDCERTDPEMVPPPRR